MRLQTKFSSIMTPKNLVLEDGVIGIGNSNSIVQYSTVKYSKFLLSMTIILEFI